MRNAVYRGRGKESRTTRRQEDDGMINSEAVPVFTQAFQIEAVAWMALGLAVLALLVSLVRR